MNSEFDGIGVVCNVDAQLTIATIRSRTATNADCPSTHSAESIIAGYAVRV